MVESNIYIYIYLYTHVYDIYIYIYIYELFSFLCVRVVIGVWPNPLSPCPRNVSTTCEACGSQVGTTSSAKIGTTNKKGIELCYGCRRPIPDFVAFCEMPHHAPRKVTC